MERKLTKVIRQQADLHMVLALGTNLPNVEYISKLTTDQAPNPATMQQTDLDYMRDSFADLDGGLFQIYYKVVKNDVSLGVIDREELEETLTCLRKIGFAVANACNDKFPDPPLRTMSRFARQMTAMHLLLYTEDAKEGTETPFPVINYILQRGASNSMPPTIKEVLATGSQEILADMLYLFDFNLYGAYHKMIHFGLDDVNLAYLVAAMGKLSILSEKTSNLATVPMVPWDGPSPHPCFHLLREVIPRYLD